MLNPPPYKTFPLNSYELEMKRSLRAMRGWSDFELTVNVGQPERDFLVSFAKLPEESLNDERKLASALKDLLRFVMELKAPKAPAEGAE